MKDGNELDKHGATRRVAPPGKKWCNYGKHFVALGDFGGQSYCKECTTEYHREYAANYYASELVRLREEAFRRFGRRCRCGESRLPALTFRPLGPGLNERETLRFHEKTMWDDSLKVICRNCIACMEAE